MRTHPEWGAPLSEPHPVGLNPRKVRHSSLNVSIPEARAWLTDTIGGLMVKNHIEGYREDCGLPYAGEDTPDRAGISEIRSVEALYEIWDSYREKIPTLVIDNCGGGGSRVDLETLSRSYVLWRSDYNCAPQADPLGSQAGNWGLGHFIPLVNGAAPVRPGSTYTFRSSLYGGMPFGLYHPCGYGSAPTGPAPDYPVEWHRRMLETWQSVKPLLSGDFFPLTGCDIAPDSVCAYAFWRPDLNRGVLMAFFRQECPENELSLTLPLPAGTYRFTDADSGAVWEAASSENGVSVTVTAGEKPCAALVYFSALPDGAR